MVLSLIFIMRLIDADKIEWEGFPNDYGEYYPDFARKKNIDEMPTVDAAIIIHGEWIGERGDYICSRCGSEGPDGGYWPSSYCPSCGAKMNTDGIDADNFWYPCHYENLSLLHEGTFVDGRWYEWLDKNHNKEVARMKTDAEDHFFPPTKVIKEENVIAFREFLCWR